jgi:hypothetical protein
MSFIADAEPRATRPPAGGDPWGDDSFDGESFVWFPDDSCPPTYNPLSDVRVGAEPLDAAELVQAVVEQCAQGLAVLERIDPSRFDAAGTAAWAVGVEQLRRQSEAAATAVAQHLHDGQPFRDQGFFTAKAWMKHHLQLSGAEAHGRVQQAQLRRVAQVWNNALGGGQVGVAQTRLMARIAANPRIPAEVLAAGVWQLMSDAMDVSYDEFERRALAWEALADPVGTAEKAERARERRAATLHPSPDGGWVLHATFDDVGGPEFLEIFSWYVDREFARDWAEATARLGDGNVQLGSLRRSEPQRRSDALLEMARAAAACPPDTARPLPMVNFIINETAAAAAADHELVDPADYRDVVSRTDRGHRVDPSAVIGVSLWSLIRRVVIDAKGVVIDLGRTSRLFTGYAREAVMLLEPTCIWPGCDQPHAWCHADHLTSWSTRGPTDQHNGAPLCPRHNFFKEGGFTVFRDDIGGWRIIGPDGTIIA